MTNPMFESECNGPPAGGRAGNHTRSAEDHTLRSRWTLGVPAAWFLACLFFVPAAAAPQPLPTAPQNASRQKTRQPARVAEAQRFLAQRGWTSGHRIPARATTLRGGVSPGYVALSQNAAISPAAATWQPLGPTAVLTPDFGLISGRISALALDPSDSTGDRLYVGATGGGVWAANNAGVSTPSSIAFTPLTDNVAALGGVIGNSISIGALTVQPGETGVVLAGTGDPNDALDSYYGAGILRSADGGNTWSLIQTTADLEDNLSGKDMSFVGEGFAGFAWSTVNPQLVVAAVSQAYEGELVDLDLTGANYQGLYYSSDSGASWHLATITDGGGEDVQGPLDLEASEGNAATAVVWNPVRQLFVAAVRYHGYYQSPDGITWTRMTAQPGAGLTTEMCPTDAGNIGSVACPIFRGALAVNPQSGDTFAWTVDLNNQDQGLWQDQCAISSGSCTNPTITFGQQWSTAALETSTLQGAVIISDGVYNLALAAVPSQQDTLLLAGANDLWKCSLAMGCVWRNTTNSTTCMSAQVGEFQHSLAWNTANPLEIFLGNDSGLWRSTDAIGESTLANPEPACSATDATHFQNLNGSLGSLAEAQSLSPIFNSPYTVLAGLGVNGFAGVKNSSATEDWPQILSGYGGPVAVNPQNTSDWYVNDQPGVAIYACTQNAPCTPSAFGSSPVVTDADVGGDGYAMPTPAPFLVDPSDGSQLLIGTCRVWRGPVNGSGWSASNVISPILDSGATGVPCNGDALIRSIAAFLLPDGPEVIYLGMYGSANGGSNLPGHVLSADFNPSSGASPVWTDLTSNPVVNDSYPLNYYGLDISSITIDSHDATGNTVYVTVEGVESAQYDVQVVYRSTNGGATWNDLSSNLPAAPANSAAVDPQDANTVYVATDAGVFYTTEIAKCATAPPDCWSYFGSGLPDAPAVALSVSPPSASQQVLVAATYGRGIWQTPLWSSATAITAATAVPANVAFSQSPAVGVASTSVQVQLVNTGSLPLTVTSIVMGGNDPGDFSETDNCQSPAASAVAVGAQCLVNVTFTPQMAGQERTAVMTIYGNIYSGQLTVDLTGTGTASTGAVSLTPNPLNFSPVEVGTTSAPLPITVANSAASEIPIASISITAPFLIYSNACGTTSLAANNDCPLDVEFAPTQAGAVTGLLTFTDAAGTQTVELTGSGQASPTDILDPTSLAFSPTPVGQSVSLPVTITNLGDLPLTNLSLSLSSVPGGQFQVANPCGTQVAAQHPGICTLTLQFTPTQPGAVTGTLTVSDYTTNVDTQTVALSETGLAAPALGVYPASLTFTNQQPGVASAPQSLTITNSGGAPLSNVGFVITGAAASSYTIASDNCGSLLNNGSSCAVQIVFTPNATGVIAATLAISSSTFGVAAVSVPLNGSGQLSTGLTTNPTQLNFPVTGAGQSSAAQAVTITNSSAYAIGSVALATAAPFTITQNSCSGSLAAGANCAASVAFLPNAGGPASGSLTVSSAAVAAPATVVLSGTGFDFTVGFVGPSSQSAAAGQQANFTLVIEPTGSSGSFIFTCGTLPSNALCLFSPSTETLNAGVQGNVEVEISTGSSSTARIERPGPFRAAPLLCGLLLLPIALTRRRRTLLLALLVAVLAGCVTSCVSSGGGTGGTGGIGGSGSGSTTPTGTYTIPVTVTSTGVSQSINLSLTVD
jgi:hypothetical protein